MSTMIAYEPAVDRMTAILCNKFDDFTKRKNWVDVPEFMQLYAFDVIADITVSSRPSS